MARGRGKRVAYSVKSKAPQRRTSANEAGETIDDYCGLCKALSNDNEDEALFYGHIDLCIKIGKLSS